MNAQRRTIPFGDQCTHSIVLPLLIIGDVAGNRMFRADAIGQHQFFIQQFGRQTHLAHSHGGEDHPVRPMRQQQIDGVLRAVIGEQVDDKTVPTVFTRGFFNRQDHVNRERGGRGIQRQHAEGLHPAAVTANTPRREIGHVIELVNCQLNALVGVRPQLIGLVDGAGYRH
ncbi:hypothetical protein D3C73_741850 [compost metagenome]